MRAFFLLPILLARLCSSTAVNKPAIPAVNRDVALTRSTGSALTTVPFDADETSLELSSNLVGRADASDDSVDPVMSPEKGLGLLLGSIRNRFIYFAAAKVSHILVKTVLAQLEKHNVVGKPDKATIEFIESALTKVTIIILMMALVAQVSPHAGLQTAAVGLDDGKTAKVKRDSFLVDHPDHPVDLITWDLSDDEAHSMGNNFSNRAIISDELRSEMVAEGHRNVTFLHTSHPGHDSKSPVLVYNTADDRSHYHWRPFESRSQLTSRENHLEKHFPFFDANGAGFKISSQNPIDRRGSAASQEDAAAMATLMVRDFLRKRTAASAAGYEEQFKVNNFVGHKLCYIAELNRFKLNNEVGLCFGNEEDAN